MRVAQVNESAHLNSVGNLIPPTDWPTDRPRTLGQPSRAGVRVGRIMDGEADWSTAPVKGNFDEFYNQWLTHQHSYQMAELFNRRNITALNH